MSTISDRVKEIASTEATRAFGSGEQPDVDACERAILRAIAAVRRIRDRRPAPAEVARVTWRKEPPTAKEAHECPRWWFRGWLNCFKPMPANDRTGGVLLVLDPDPIGEGIYAAETPDEMGMEIETYTVDNCKGEWAPCVMPPC